MRVAFVIGSPAISGGTYVILQHALYLQKKGHHVDLLAIYPFSAKDLRWHDAYNTLECLDFYKMIKEARQYDIAIATWWRTATELHLLNADCYIYFVQSIESRFYDAKEVALRVLVDSTYTLKLPVITEATWIRDYLTQHFSADVSLVKNGIRKDLYKKEGENEAPPIKGLRVLVEGPLGVPFKNVEKTIELVNRSNAASVWLLTSSDVKQVEGVDRVFSRVPIEEVPRIYRSCDVIVKLSLVEGMFGPPLEMFHCGGTAIVYNVSGHDEYIRDNFNGIVIRTGDEDEVVQAINALVMDQNKLDKFKTAALTTASTWPDWEYSSSEFEKALLKYFQMQPKISQADLQMLNEKNFKIYCQATKTEKACGSVKLSLYKWGYACYRMLPTNLKRIAKYLKQKYLF